MARPVAARAAILAIALLPAGWIGAPGAQSAALPERLSGEAFWELSQALSEPDGFFPSDNLVSNEGSFQAVLPALIERAGTGGVFLGVGPEQNFTYIAALRPRIAFVIDVRGGNRHLHLLYKALFELADDRAAFIARLFSRPRPPGLARDATAAELFAALAPVAAPDDFDRNLRIVREHLVKTRKLPLTPDDLAGVAYVYRQFSTFGPGITYSSSRFRRVGTGTTYALLMTATDEAGVPRSFLATEASFQTVKRLQAANLLIPVVGDFAGPSALRAIGAWLGERQATVSAFYLSNVEDYLSRDRRWLDFCHSAAALPLSPRATFIRSGRGYQPVDDRLARGRRMLGSVSQFERMAQPSLRNLPAVRLGAIRDDLSPCTAESGP